MSWRPPLPLAVPFLPNQRVIVFQADLSSGDTLGYHGIIVQLHAKSRFQYPNDPERWVYRVSVPCLGRQIDVASMDLFATEALNDFPLRLETALSQPVCEFRFNSPIEDNCQIEGAFRMPPGKWVTFTFRKSERPQAAYKLSFELDGLQLGSGQLQYEVPTTDSLDRQFVLQAIAGIIGTEKVHDE